MLKIQTYCFIFVIILIKIENLKASSGCNEIFELKQDSGGIFGLITIKNPNWISNYLDVEMSLAAKLPNAYFGSVDLLNGVNNAVYEIQNGLPIKYRVNFPLQSPLPKPTAISLNSQQLCSGHPEIASYVTTIKLKHELQTGLSGLPPLPAKYPQLISHTYSHPAQRPDSNHNQISYYTTTVVPKIPEVPHINPIYPVADFECGTREFDKTTSLIINGKEAHRGQFPWLAAFYYSGESSNGFICGGSLISTKIVVTAAHCVLNKEDSIPRKPEDSFFHLGKNDISQLFEENSLQSAVSKFVIHTDWNPNEPKYDGDISIAILSRTISFNKFIKPICLWTSSKGFDDIVGHQGTVAGWGKTDLNSGTSAKAIYAKVQVVDTLTCLQASEYFQKLVSTRTFCAGNHKNSSGPCNGDSGGGFVFESDRKFYLRGVVSSSLINDDGLCDTKNYAVFTDVTQFTSWIQGFVKKHG